MFDFDAENIAVEFEVESLHQAPITAPEVDYSTAAGNVLHDEFVSETDGGIGDLVAGTGALGHWLSSLVRAAVERGWGQVWEAEVRRRERGRGLLVWQRWQPCFLESPGDWAD